MYISQSEIVWVQHNYPNGTVVIYQMYVRQEDFPQVALSVTTVTHLLELSAPPLSAVESVEKMQEKLHGRRVSLQIGLLCRRFVSAKPTIDLILKPVVNPFSVFEVPTTKSILLFQTDTFAAVYKKLTGKEVTFEFPEPYL